MSLRRNFSAAGGIYLALAERLDASFLTADERLTRATRRHMDVKTI